MRVRRDSSAVASVSEWDHLGIRATPLPAYHASVMRMLPGRALAVMALAMALAGCSFFYGPMGYGTDERPLAKDTWEGEWEPLHEFAPLANEPDWVTFTATDHTMLGIEGYIVFVRVEDASGSVVIDRRVDFDSTLDQGSYTVTGYYRACDGNCGMLDPSGELCTTPLEVRPGESPTVVVSVEHKRCTVEPA
jgi:hypothetical protein